MTTVSFEAHGLGFDITSSNAEVTETFADLLIDMRAERSRTPTRSTAAHLIEIEPVEDPVDGEPRFSVHFDGATVYETLIEGSVVSHVLMEVNQLVATALRSAGSIPLHASSVAGARGAIVLAGASHSGKTTLASALALTGRNGLQFLADEISALEPTQLTVASYGKPAALRSPGLDLLAPYVERLQRAGSRFETDERFVPPSELSARPDEPSRISAIVFPRFDATVAGSSAQLTAVVPADALTRLMHLTLGTASLDVDTFRSLERLARTVVIEIAYADAIEAAGQLIEAVQG